VIRKRWAVLITLPFLLAAVVEGQDQQDQVGPGSADRSYTIIGAVKRPGGVCADKAN
jgi:hypothetical protein